MNLSSTSLSLLTLLTRQMVLPTVLLILTTALMNYVKTNMATRALRLILTKLTLKTIGKFLLFTRLDKGYPLVHSPSFPDDGEPVGAHPPPPLTHSTHPEGIEHNVAVHFGQLTVPTPPCMTGNPSVFMCIQAEAERETQPIVPPCTLDARHPHPSHGEQAEEAKSEGLPPGQSACTCNLACMHSTLMQPRGCEGAIKHPQSSEGVDQHTSSCETRSPQVKVQPAPCTIQPSADGLGHALAPHPLSQLPHLRRLTVKVNAHSDIIQACSTPGLGLIEKLNSKVDELDCTRLLCDDIRGEVVSLLVNLDGMMWRLKDFHGQQMLWHTGPCAH